MKKILLIYTLLFTFQYPTFSQDQHLVDSLTTQLKNHKFIKLKLHIKSLSLYDTTAANILNSLSRAYWRNNPDKAMDYANQCLALSEKIGYKKGIGNAYNSLGVIADDKGDYLPALEFYKKALKIREEIGDKKGIAGSYNNIGLIYNEQGNYPEALKNYFASLKIREEIGDKSGIAMSYNNIGEIYYAQGNYPKALKNQFASLKIKEEIGDKYGIAAIYNNIGEIYRIQGKYAEALSNYFAALKINKEIGNKISVAINLSNIGLIYKEQGNYIEALRNYLVTLKLSNEIGDKNGIAGSYNNIGAIYIYQKKYKDALQYLNKALSLSMEIGSLEEIKYSYESLAKLDSAQGNYKQALEHYKLYINARDSLVNNENTKKITQQQMQFEFDKKEAITQTEHKKKDAIQRLTRNILIGGLLVVLIFAGVFFRQRNKTIKEKLRAEEEMKRAEEEKMRSEELLLNILPAEVAEEIKKTGTAKAKAFTMVTVMFTDFKDFTKVSERVSAELLVDEIHTCFSTFDNIINKYKIEKIKTIGDAYLCASGLPASNYTHGIDMINASFEIRDYMQHRKKEKEARGEIPFELRIGIHTGPVVAGIVGVKKYAYDIWGDTVNIAARMEQNSEAGKINISGSTYELVKDKFNCVHRGKILAKNKGKIDMYFVESSI